MHGRPDPRNPIRTAVYLSFLMVAIASTAMASTKYASAFTLSISMVATRELVRTEPPSRILFYYFSLSLVCVGVTIYFALILYTCAYGMAPAFAIAPINYFAVVAAGFWGWLIWQQVPDTWALVGSALVIVGGLMAVYQARNAEASV